LSNECKYSIHNTQLTTHDKECAWRNRSVFCIGRLLYLPVIFVTLEYSKHKVIMILLLFILSNARLHRLIAKHLFKKKENSTWFLSSNVHERRNDKDRLSNVLLLNNETFLSIVEHYDRLNKARWSCNPPVSHFCIRLYR
jgi:hypothetical protein